MEMEKKNTVFCANANVILRYSFNVRLSGTAYDVIQMAATEDS